MTLDRPGQPDKPDKPGQPAMQPYGPTSEAQYRSALARTTPEVERVREGVWAIPLPLPRTGVVESTLCYALGDASGGVHLVDPGWDTDDNLARLETALTHAGFALHDIRSTVSTHAHPDHLGLGGRLQRERGVPLALHGSDHWAAGPPDRAHAEQALQRWGVPTEELEALRAVGQPGSSRPTFEPSVLLSDGDVLDIPGRRVRVIATPGHTAGSICLLDEGDALLFSGDHVLPIITPGLGLGGFGPEDDPIGAALDSYERMAAYDEVEVCPGHGYRFRGLAARAAELARRHRRRREEIAGLRREHPDASVWEIARRVSWTDGWGGLTPFLRRSALAQTELFLAHLERAGR
ncbi:MBL fold metallo-hydrolase [Microbacterium album]|uniref:MBL fold metallo-hydrolase n=1 Tax=Microbacterium album TaxID=2053191 RepID=A0A917IH46_9MICO|nr:MBL fold metallo-hydrolase [Microbacterium album]GGH45285.1 MBL fold metallo-hydrolase [Microbacterium album]